MAQHGFKALAVGVVRVGGLDHAALDAWQHILQGCRFTAPPARNGRQLQFFAQQVTRQRRHEAQQRIRFKKARAWGVGHQHVAAAHGLQQAWHTQCGVGTQLQRVEPVVVDPLEQAVHGLQTLQGLQVELFIAHRQVIALHQTQAQIAGQVGVLKIGFVVGTRGQQCNVGRGTCGAARLDAIDQRAVGFGQLLHGESLEGLREKPRDDLPVFKQIAQTGWRLRALRQQPPAAIRASGQIKRGQGQIAPTHRGNAVHGRQVSGVALHQGGGQLATEHQLLWPVGIGHDALEQLHALHHPRINLLPVGRPQHERKQVERPGALWLVSGGIHVVGDAVVAHLPLQVGHAVVQVRQQTLALRTQGFNEAFPEAADGLGATRFFTWCLCLGGWGELSPQFVPMPGRGALLLKLEPCHGFGFERAVLVGRGIIHQTIVADQTRLRSSVYGNSGLA